MENHHENMMQLALAEAEKAGQNQEVPIGALLVSEAGDILAKAYNRVIGLADPTGHAEILAMRVAAQKVKNYRLLNTTLYVTVEPCVMCMGAILHARIARVVYGAPDPKWGALGSIYDFAAEKRFNHHPEIIAGICEKECRSIIQDFFKAKRQS